MSLGRPNLYVAGALVAGSISTDVTALAGAKINWGTDSRVDFAGPSTLACDVLVKSGAVPAWSNGTQVGLVDPLSGRCLFAGHISNLTAATDSSIKTALRIRFTATSPLADLKNHLLRDLEWAESSQAARLNGLAGTIARGWTIQQIYSGLDWINSGRIRFQEINWLELLEMWCRTNIGRYVDTSSYTPGAGFTKRLTITRERDKAVVAPPAPGAAGVWDAGTRPAHSSGIAALPAGMIGREIEWEKNPDDTITDLDVGTFGLAYIPPDQDSKRFAYDMYALAGVDNRALQDAYGFRQLSLDTMISSQNTPALQSWLKNDLAPYWLDADTQWRPVAVDVPDGNRLDTAPLLNLLAVDTRPRAALYVPPGVGINPAKIHAYVTKGEATWTGKKWTATFTLGRTFD